MAVSKIDPSAKKPKTLTAPYGGGSKAATSGVKTPTLHELAIQSVEEAYGPDAHNNPTFDARVKDVEAQMLNSVESTKNL